MYIASNQSAFAVHSWNNSHSYGPIDGTMENDGARSKWFENE
jgi:hypothetical protein